MQNNSTPSSHSTGAAAAFGIGRQDQQQATQEETPQFQ